MRSRSGAALVVLACALAPSPAEAHSVGVSRGDYTLIGNALEAVITFARPELIGSIPELDKNGDGQVDESELAGAKPALEAQIVKPIAVRAPAGLCPGTLSGASLAEQDGLTVYATFRCDARPTSLVMTLDFVGAMSHGHRHLATATANGAIAHGVIYVGSSELRLAIPEGAQETAPASESSGTSPFTAGVFNFFAWPHVLFLLALILIGRKPQPMIQLALAFTAAWSLALVLAAAELLTPSAGFTAPAVVFSVVYVGVEDLFIKDLRHRWLVALPFGLLHGFAFADHLPARAPSTLAAYHAGLLLAELALLLAAVPLLVRVRRR